MKCSECGKKITLTPSAKERAKKYGGKPSYYIGLFTIHADCLLSLRMREVQILIEENKRRTTYQPQSCFPLKEKQ